MKNIERTLKPAVFLDRDGVLTEEKGYVRSINELTIFEYSRECISDIHAKGYWAIVLTNQSGIARGFFEEKELIAMNRLLTDKLDIDGVFYCPHHPEGIIPKYTKSCNCRKPNTGLIDQACKSFQIDLSRSWMVGDRGSDIEMGKAAGLKTVMLESGYGSSEINIDNKPDYICDDLREFVNII